MRASVAVLVVAWLAIAAQAPSRAVDDWPAYGHDGGGMRFSPLTDVNRTNVDRLQVAWTVHTGDIADGKDGHPRSGFETTPIVVDGVLYFTTAFNRVVALDPETGAQKWAFDPTIDRTLAYGDGLVNRGVSTWLDSSRRAGEPCRRRIFEATLDARLIALDAVTGTPCDGFGRDGTVSLADVEAYRPGAYHLTSAPAILDDLVVVGSAMSSTGRQYVVTAAGGHAKITEEPQGDALVAFALRQ